MEFHTSRSCRSREVNMVQNVKSFLMDWIVDGFNKKAVDIEPKVGSISFGSGY